MARKRKEVLTEGPIDKVDLFLKQNFKTIMVAVSVVIVAFFGGMAFKKKAASAAVVKNNTISAMEMAGLFTSEQISGYSKLAEDLNYAKDYVHLNAAQKYNNIGETEKALAELALVGGDFKELADSLAYDINGGKDAKGAKIDAVKYARNGLFSSVWYHRAINEGGGDALIAEYKEKWPESLFIK